MTALRSLANVAEAVERLGLRRTRTQLAEVAFECPVCRSAGLKALASVEVKFGVLIAQCAGCDRAGDDPDDILDVLAGEDRDPWHGDPCEVLIRWFDLQWAIARADGVAA